MTNETPCAPRPWTKNRFGTLVDANGRAVIIADVGIGLSTGVPSGDAKEAGKFLLKAVNSHDEMAELLERAVTDDMTETGLREFETAARTLLTKIKGNETK